MQLNEKGSSDVVKCVASQVQENVAVATVDHIGRPILLGVLSQRFAASEEEEVLLDARLRLPESCFLVSWTFLH